MTELIIDFPSEIRINELEIKTRLEVPTIPAEKITGVLHPDQIPLGVIPDLEGLVQIQDDLTGLTSRVLTLEEAETVTPAMFGSHVEANGLGSHIPQFGITNAHIANGAAIEPSKLNLPDLYTALALDAFMTETETTVFLTPHLTSFGLGGHIPSTGLTNSHIADNASIAPTKLDLTALASALNLQSGSVSISELTYTVTQSSVYDAPGTVNQGTFAKLTDGSNTTGAGTLNAQTTGVPQWIQVDLGQVRNVLSVTVAGGVLGGGFGSASAYVNNARIEISDNASTWELLTVVQGVTDGNLAGISGRAIPVLIPLERRFRYLRLWRSDSWLATTELRLRGW